jgi:regulation of enolase protein 1 (concanavalin A-like superfamily)
MLTDRRGFLQTSVMLGCARATGETVLAKAASVSSEQTHVLDECPASFRNHGHALVVRSKSKSDFWRKTFYGYITDNGLFFHVPVSGDFVFEAQVNGQYAALYDQAGLMLRLDSENWMKCGCEFFGQQRYASVVLTRGFSDWSTMSDLSDTAAIWWRAIRQKRLSKPIAQRQRLDRCPPGLFSAERESRSRHPVRPRRPRLRRHLRPP